MRQHLALYEGLDDAFLQKRNLFAVAEFGVRFVLDDVRFAPQVLLVPAAQRISLGFAGLVNFLDDGLGVLVAHRERVLQELEPLCGELHTRLLEQLEELIKVGVRPRAELWSNTVYEIGERLLSRLRTGSAERRPSLVSQFEAQPERTLDGKLPISERLVSKNLRLLRLLESEKSVADPLDVLTESSQFFLPRFFRSGLYHCVASMSCTLPLRCAGLQFVSTQM